MATDESNWNAIATILDTLASAGFSGVRLPMFPESDQVTGIDPTFGQISNTIGWKECDNYAQNIAQRIINSPSIEVDSFFGF